MNIITFHQQLDLNFSKSSHVVTQFRGQPGRNYIFGRAQLIRLSQQPDFSKAVLKQSLLDPRLANFVARSGVGGPVLVYNGSGGYGDQIMTWPFTLILHNLGYQVHVLVDPGNEDCWSNFPWIHSVSSLPMDLNVFALFQHHIMFEVVANLDEHTPQHHPLDSMLFKVGINPHAIDKKVKCVAPQFTATEVEAASRIIAGRKIGIYQLTAAARVRSLTPDESVSLLFKLAQEFPDITWFAVYDGIGHSIVFKDILVEHPTNVVPFISHSLRVLWAMIDQACVCVGPDSMIVHIAGSLAKPAVGLWGPTGPESRVAYYPNHTALFPKGACHMAPCHSYMTHFPRYCPSHNLPPCAVLSNISFDDVIDGVRKYA